MEPCWGPDYLALPAETSLWLWRDLIPVGGVVNLAGAPKAGKSFLALQIAAAVATPGCSEMLGIPVDLHGPVLYVQLDMPRGIWKLYVRNVLTAYPKCDVRNLAFVDRFMPDLPYPINIAGPTGDWLAEHIDSINPVLVIYDNLRELHPEDENDSTVMRNVFAALRATTSSAILLVSHTRKPSKEGSSGGLEASTRGSSYIAGAVDVLMQLTKTQLRVKGRTAFDEPLSIYKGDGGPIMRNTKDADVRELLKELEGLPAREKDRRIVAATGWSERTARKHRLDLEDA